MKPNLPTEEGRRCGGVLAEFVEFIRAQDPTLPEPCVDCAFRAGTFPNGCEETLSDAMQCLSVGDVFYCHLTDKTCAGYAVLKTEIIT